MFLSFLINVFVESLKNCVEFLILKEYLNQWKIKLKYMKEIVFVGTFAAALLFCLLGVLFLLLAKYGKGNEERKRICNVHSWIFFYIAIGIVISAVIVYLMLNYNGSLN